MATNPKDDDQRPRPELAPIPYARQSIDASDAEAVLAALYSDFLTQGPQVERFEHGLREVAGARHAVVVSSGTAALHLACLGLGVGAGDCGIVPAITFAATANCLRYAGARTVCCDVDSRSGLATAEHFKQAAGSPVAAGSVRLALPVSFAGAAPDLPGIADWARREGAFVIEDAAHSIGGRYALSDGGSGLSGSCQHSDAAIMSFHPVKHVCAGEGGVVLTNDAVLAGRVRKLRSHGMERGEGWLYNQTELGYNYRMTDLQAALGSSQLSRLAENLRRRRELAARYAEAFGQEPFRSRIHAAMPDDLSAWHLYVIHFANSAEREAAYWSLRERSINAQVHYIPVYRHDYHRDSVAENLPGAERYYASCLSLPLYPTLTDADQLRVIDALRAFLDTRSA